MRNSLFLLLVLFLCVSASAQNKNYDSLLAKKLQADDYGMKHYVMAFLKPGPNRDVDSSKRNELLQAHLKNIWRLAKEGKLAIAGPFLDNGKFSGVYIFSVATVEEAKALTETDPAVKAGFFDMELHPWYGSAALMQVPSIHNTLQKKSLTD